MLFPASLWLDTDRLLIFFIIRLKSTQWSSFCRRHFKIHFLQWHVSYCDTNLRFLRLSFTEAVSKTYITLQWRHNGHDSVSNQQPHDRFTQPFIQTQIKENIKAPRHWPLCGEFTGDRWIPRTKGQLRVKCFHLMTSSWISQVIPWQENDKPGTKHEYMHIFGG